MWKNVTICNAYIPGNEVFDLYYESIFVPCGRGNFSLDCFRNYEATIAGAIPVIVGPMNEIEWTYKFEETPPWIYAESWSEALKKCQEIQFDFDTLEKMQNENIDFTVISFLPNWADADYIQLFLQSKYLITYKIVNKGDYILHEKDKGKLIKGTFELLVIVMNSKKNSWDAEKMDNVNKNFKDIIKLMKDETYLGNIEI
jgi:hypothetical protein